MTPVRGVHVANCDYFKKMFCSWTYVCESIDLEDDIIPNIASNQGYNYVLFIVLQAMQMWNLSAK